MRLVVVATVVLCATAVLAQTPTASVARVNGIEATAFELPEDYLDLILQDELSGMASQHEQLQPVLQWYRDLCLCPWIRWEESNPMQLVSRFYALTKALKESDPVAILFVKSMRPRMACKLVEMIVRNQDLSYSSKTDLLGALISTNPDLFSLNKVQIPPNFLTHIAKCLAQVRQEPKPYYQPPTKKDVRLFQQLYPEPFCHLILVRKHLELPLKSLPVDTLIKSIPLLARLGIRMEFSEILVQVTDVSQLIELYPFLSMTNFWTDLDRWLSSVGRPADGSFARLSAKSSLLRLSSGILQLLSIPEFVHDAEIETHSKVCERFMVFLQYHVFSVYFEMLLHKVTNRKKIAFVMARGRELRFYANIRDYRF